MAAHRATDPAVPSVLVVDSSSVLSVDARHRLEAALAVRARTVDWLFDSIGAYDLQPLDERYLASSETTMSSSATAGPARGGRGGPSGGRGDHDDEVEPQHVSASLDDVDAGLTLAPSAEADYAAGSTQQL